MTNNYIMLVAMDDFHTYDIHFGLQNVIHLSHTNSRCIILLITICKPAHHFCNQTYFQRSASLKTFRELIKIEFSIQFDRL